jgi:hypothetical protein
LVTDHQTGKLRETALWSNIGKAAMTWAFVYTVYSREGNTEWLWMAYGSIVVSHELMARYFNQKQQVLNKEVGNAQPTT